MKIEIEISEEIIARVASTAAAGAFETAYGGDHRGSAAKAMAAEVNRQVAAIDWAPLVKEAIDRIAGLALDSIAEDVVRKAVKQAAKRLEVASEAKQLSVLSVL